MLLVIDVGNSNVKMGLFVQGELQHSWRLSTKLGCTADEYGVQIEAIFCHLHLSTAMVKGIIVSSVNPSINYTIEHMCRLYFPSVQMHFVSCTMELDLDILYDIPSQLGADRICNAVAAYHRYGASIVVDFGTATAYTAVNAHGELLGGVICPGILISIDALVSKAAMLYKVEFVKPEKVIGRNTQDALQSGLIRGFVGQVEYIVRQMRGEMDCPCTVVATGGMSDTMAHETDSIDVVNPTLTLEGLREIYTMNFS